jgi:hypothetical protein
VGSGFTYRIFTGLTKMKLNSFFATVLLFSCSSTFAQERLDLAAWQAAKPASSVSVTPSTKAGEFVVSAVFTDLNTARLLARPTLIAVVGKPARIEIGSEPGILIRITVEISADGRNVKYVTEQLKDGKLESSHSSALSLSGV